MVHQITGSSVHQDTGNSSQKRQSAEKCVCERRKGGMRLRSSNGFKLNDLAGPGRDFLVEVLVFEL